MEGVHDLGGVGGFGPVVTEGGGATHREDWELRAFLLSLAGLRGVNARPYLEALDPVTYLNSSYYARWLAAGETGIVAEGRLSQDDLDRWRAVIDQGGQLPEVRDPAIAELVVQAFTQRQPTMPPPVRARFARGDAVVVRRMWDEVHHHRCPRYVRGVRGVVDAVCGDGLVPEGEHADDREPEYTVKFASGDLWGHTDEPPFQVFVDLYEQYLEPA